MTTNHTKDEARLTCHQVHPECDVYHPDGHPIKDETLTPDAKTVEIVELIKELRNQIDYEPGVIQGTSLPTGAPYKTPNTPD